MKIRTLLVSAVATLTLVSCANEPINFANLSPVELDDYNRDKPMMDKVYCQEERRTGSFIRKRWCRTVQDWVEHNTRTMMALDTMNTPNGSVIRGGN